MSRSRRSARWALAVVGALLSTQAAAGEPAQEPAAAAGATFGAADLDPDNDAVVAPPEHEPDCAAKLAAAGVSYQPAELPVKRRGGFECGAPDVVVYRGTSRKIRWSSSPVVSCGMALALARFEAIADEEARRVFGERVVAIEHGGTYSCRKMARFRLVSEHSYANAIDIRSFRLERGRRVSVERDFGRLDREPSAPGATFLRSVASRSYDEEVFSVVLTRFFDELHRDHLHLDLARYRIDGTRAAAGVDPG